MQEQNPANLEQDPRFSSGPWTGYFLQFWLPGRHTTNVDLTCCNGELRGTGSDLVGPYTIEGHYDLGTGKCEWIKQYVRKHSVTYRGINDGHGIWGVWEIRQLAGLFVDRGGFHIWPEGLDVSEESDRTEQAVLAAMRTQFGSRLGRALRNLLFVGAAIALAVLLWRCWEY